MPEIPSGYSGITVPMVHDGLARQAVITFGVDHDAGLLSANDVANAVLDAIDTTWQPAISSNVQIGPVKADYNSGGGPVPGFSDTSIRGLAAQNSVPSNCALLVRKASILSGRANRGRFYLPWSLEESDVSAIGIIDGSTVTDYQGLMDDFLTALSANDVPMVVLHSGAGTPAPVSALNVAGLVATQRRRLRSS